MQNFTAAGAVIQTFALPMMENDASTVSMLDVNSTNNSAGELVAPRFTHIALVKVIVLSAMFVVSLSANSAHHFKVKRSFKVNN